MWEVQEAVQFLACLHDPQERAVPGKRPFPLNSLSGQQQRVQPPHHSGAAGSERQPTGTVLQASRLCHPDFGSQDTLCEAFISNNASRLTSVSRGAVGTSWLNLPGPLQ